MLKNEAQEKIINTIDGQLIVVACPGSGKTTTLVRRINHMVKTGIDPRSIIMMTFSKAAAKEMKERYTKQFPENPQGVNFCTIHAFCLAILTTFFGYERRCTINSIDVNDFFYGILKGNRDVADDIPGFIKKLLLDIGCVKNMLIEPQDYTPTCTSDKDFFIRLYEQYEEYKNNCGLIDFDDMLVLTLRGLQANPKVVQSLQETYKYIQVDEYQDTNNVQSQIIYLIAGENGNLAVVGDDDQSIYGFRAATPEIMLSFKKQYPDAIQVNMSTNYRSSSNIIKAADMVIKKNKNRFSKDFIGSKETEGSVYVSMFQTRIEETVDIAKKIKMRNAQGQSYKDFAILYRNNSQADRIANELAKVGIPFVSTEAIKFRYDSWIFRDISYFHRLAEGDDFGSKQKEAEVVYSLINRPSRYIQRTMTVHGADYTYMKEAAKRSFLKQWQKEKMYDNIDEFFSFCTSLKGENPKDSLRVIRTGLRYQEYLYDYAEKRMEDPREYIDTYNSFMEDVENNNIDTWEKWDVYIKKTKKAFEDHNKKNLDADAVTLSTMHKSKGLEWKVVFLPNSNDSIIPGTERMEKDLKTESNVSERHRMEAKIKTRIEEERRLYYVAMTRAKEELWVSYNGRAKQSRYVRDFENMAKKYIDESDTLNSRLKKL